MVYREATRERRESLSCYIQDATVDSKVLDTIPPEWGARRVEDGRLTRSMSYENDKRRTHKERLLKTKKIRGQRPCTEIKDKDRISKRGPLSYKIRASKKG